jgi:hypothetical protein
LLANQSTQIVHTILPTQRLVHSIFHACQGQCLVSSVQAIHPTLMDRGLPASMIVANVEMSSTRQIQWTTAWHALPNAVLSNTNQCNALRPQTEGVEPAFRQTVAKMQEIPVSRIAKRISSSSFITVAREEPTAWQTPFITRLTRDHYHCRRRRTHCVSSAR